MPSQSRSAEGGRVVRVMAPPERHIEVPWNELRSALRQHMRESDKDDFDDVCRLLQALAKLETVELGARLKHSLLPFSSGARNRAIPTLRGKRLPTRDQLKSQENRFLHDFVDVLTDAGYTHLTQSDWEIAKEEDFLFDMPVEVNWKGLADSPLTEFWSSTQGTRSLRKGMAEKADKVLVFHRGIGRATHEDLFVMQKVDLLVEYLVVNPLKALYCKARGSKQPSDPSAGTPTIGSAHLADHPMATAVERKTLKHALASPGLVFKNLFKSIEIQEPSFKEVVVLYRKVNPPVKNAKEEEPSRSEKFAKLLSKHNLYLKSFGDIAMADLDLVFPEKKVQLKPIALIQLAVTMISALITAGLTLYKGRDSVDQKLILTVLGIILARCGQMYTTMMTQKTTLEKNMSIMLYDKIRDSQEGVISVLLDEIAEQDDKLCLLAYMTVLNSGKPMSVGDIDQRCEELLKEQFDVRVNFDVQGCVPKLMGWGMLQKRAGGGLAAVQPAEARSMLHQIFSTSYSEMGNLEGGASAKALRKGFGMVGSLAGGTKGALSSGVAAGSMVGMGPRKEAPTPASAGPTVSPSQGDDRSSEGEVGPLRKNPKPTLFKRLKSKMTD